MFPKATNKKIKFLAVSFALSAYLYFLNSIRFFDYNLALLFSPFVITPVLLRLSLGAIYGIEKFVFIFVPTVLVSSVSIIFWLFPDLTPPFRFGLLFLTFSSLYLINSILNIIKVSKNVKPIPLLKAVYPVYHVLAFLAAFLSLTGLYKVGAGLWLEMPLVFVISFLVGLSYMWSFSLKNVFERTHVTASALVALGVTETALAFSFVSLEPFFRSLAVSTVFFALLSAARHYFEQDLTSKMLLEFAAIVLFVLWLVVRG